MKIDIGQQIGAVTREVRETEREGRPARMVAASRTYDTAITDVWDAITNPERIPRWFSAVTGDLRLGGRYQIEGNAAGEIVRCDAPHHLSLTWEFGGEVSWLDVRLEQDPSGATRLDLQHTARVSEHWGQFGPGAVGVGWDLTLFGLGLHLESGAGMDHAEAEAWAASTEGKDFMRGSSDAWGRADIAAGADESTALASAARTASFYTGETAPHADKAG